LDFLQEGVLDADPKRARILEGAMKSFLAYGFGRTTMDDIARASDVSRPALYLLFKNKTDIYRAIASALLQRSAAAAASALRGDKPFADLMLDALDGAIFSMMQHIEESPHGAEILDMKNSLAGEIIETWRAEMGAHLSGAIAREAARLGTDLPARRLSAASLADFVLDAMDGMKMRQADPSCHRDSAKSIIAVIVQAIRP
jgi:AcrR family transcriptional regulator